MELLEARFEIIDCSYFDSDSKIDLNFDSIQDGR